MTDDTTEGLGHGVDAREREWLLKEKYGGVESDAFRADVARLEKGEPVAYVIGFSTFLGNKIDLSQKPLIPRAETEYWVEKALSELESAHGKDAPLRILDVFSGSGCIGLAVLKRFPNAKVDFAELEPNALEQIRLNAEGNGYNAARYEIFQSDIFSGIPSGRTYDAIFANPPYIDEAHKHTRVDKSVLDHEPHVALFAKENGYELIERFFADAKKFLVSDGRIYLECDDIQKGGVEKILVKQGFTKYLFSKDQFELWRSVSVIT